MKHALRTNCVKKELDVLTQVPLPLVYREVRLDIGYRLDLVVEDIVVVEIKSIDSLAAIHQAQVILPEAQRQEAGNPD